MKPLIGITCNYPNRTVSSINSRKYNDLSSKYTEAIFHSGGIPVIIPNGMKKEDLEELVFRLDGILVSGGGDVDPSRYGKTNDGTVGGISEVRDETELSILDFVLHYTRKPVFGICRGIQVINVALGGTLIMDLPSAGKNNHSLTDHRREEFTHEIIVKEDTRLSSILGNQRKVNSFHHQAIDRLAPGLVVSAYSKEDNVIEAVEAPGDRYILAVQWHPEELTHDPDHRRLFEEFVSQCEKAE